MKIEVNATKNSDTYRSLNDGEIAWVDRSSTLGGNLRFRIGNNVYMINETTNKVQALMPGNHVYNRVEAVTKITVEI